jgi:hypothetical protein
LVVTGALAGAGLGYVFQRAELRTSGDAGKAPERTLGEAGKAPERASGEAGKAPECSHPARVAARGRR